MAYNVSVYKLPTLLGTGSMTNGSTSLTSYSGTAPINGRNIQIMATSSNNIGATIATRVISGSGTTTLVLQDKGPFS